MAIFKRVGGFEVGNGGSPVVSIHRIGYAEPVVHAETLVTSLNRRYNTRFENIRQVFCA
jgi:hypothetical protein